MATPTFYDPPQVLECATSIHTATENHQLKKLRTGIVPTSLFALYLIFLILHQTQDPLQVESSSINTLKLATRFSPVEKSSPTVSRGMAHGVSEKTFWPLTTRGLKFAWTNGMLLWQRTGYHFQPEKNWMNGKFSIFITYLFVSVILSMLIYLTLFLLFLSHGTHGWICQPVWFLQPQILMVCTYIQTSLHLFIVQLLSPLSVYRQR